MTSDNRRALQIGIAYMTAKLADDREALLEATAMAVELADGDVSKALYLLLDAVAAHFTGLVRMWAAHNQRTPEELLQLLGAAFQDE